MIAARKKMRKRDKHLLRGPQGFWNPASQRSLPVLGWTCFSVISAHLIYDFRAITTEDFRKQGPSTAQVEAGDESLEWSRVEIQVLARSPRMRLDLQEEVTGKTKASGWAGKIQLAFMMHFVVAWNSFKRSALPGKWGVQLYCCLSEALR